MRRWRHGLFGTPLNAVITIAVLALLVWAVPPLVRWALLDATWTGTADACHARSGACWAFIAEKARFITFGFYPQSQQGNEVAALVMMAALLVASTRPQSWGGKLVPIWVIGLGLAIAAMAGAPGRHYVSTSLWSGVPLTLLMALVALALAFPIALVLALARRSRFGLYRTMAVVFIEVVRGVPLVAVLYIATLLLPLMLPGGTGIDKLLRTQIMFTIFVAAYMAEIIRGGLQSVPNGQAEAAASLGLGYWATLRLVVLPQALRTSIPAFVNLAIAVLQDTTLVTVIGLFDFLNTARTATADPNWLGFYDEAYVLVAGVYFIACFAGSRYSLALERRLAREG